MVAWWGARRWGSDFGGATASGQAGGRGGRDLAAADSLGRWIVTWGAIYGR
jgi:hypothetical protein